MKLLQLDRSGDVPRMKEVEVEIGTTAPQTSTQKTIPFFISGNFIQAGDSVTLFFPNGLRIDGYALHTNIAATVVLDVRSSSGENLPSGPEDSLCGGNLPELNNAHFAGDGDLLGWNRAVDSGVIVVCVESVSGDVKSLTLQLFAVEGVDGVPILLFVADPETSGESNAYVGSPFIEFEATSLAQFPTYIHVENAGVHEQDLTPYEILFDSASSAQFPTYVHVADTGVHEPDLTPYEILFDSSSLAQFPTYVHSTVVSDLIFNAGDDISATQWAKKEHYFPTPSSGPAPFSYTVSGLPLGMSFTLENGAAKISGIPEESGVFVLTVTAIDRLGRTTPDNVALTVSAGSKIPVIESVLPTDEFVVGVFPMYLRGYSFGASGSVVVNNVALPPENVISWSDVEIAISLPTATASPAEIYVQSGGVDSVPVTVQVTYDI